MEKENVKAQKLFNGTGFGLLVADLMKRKGLTMAAAVTQIARTHPQAHAMALSILAGEPLQQAPDKPVNEGVQIFNDSMFGQYARALFQDGQAPTMEQAIRQATERRPDLHDDYIKQMTGAQ